MDLTSQKSNIDFLVFKHVALLQYQLSHKLINEEINERNNAEKKQTRIKAGKHKVNAQIKENILAQADG